jgi:hypothetical protein
LDFNGKDFDSKPFAEANTDGDGTYDVGGLPPQQYIVGINAKKYADELAYAPQYFGGTSERENATRVNLKELLDHVDLTLPPPRLPAIVVLKVEFPDGRPARSNGYPPNRSSEDNEPRSMSSASISDLKGILRAGASNIYGPSDGIYRFPLWQGETYKIKVTWGDLRFESNAGKLQSISTDWEADAGPLLLNQPETEVRLVLRLKETRTSR